MEGRTIAANTALRRPAWTTFIALFAVSFTGLLPLALPFHNGDVAANRQVVESLFPAAWLRPLHFQPVDLRPLAQSQNHARVMGGKIATASHFELMPLQASRLVGDLRADRVHVGFRSHQTNTQPMILPSGQVSQKDGRTVVLGYQQINGAVIIEISQG